MKNAPTGGNKKIKVCDIMNKFNDLNMIECEIMWDSDKECCSNGIGYAQNIPGYIAECYIDFIEIERACDNEKDILCRLTIGLDDKNSTLPYYDFN